MTSYYVVYQSETGKILRYGGCPGSVIEAQAGVGEGVLAAFEGCADQTHYVTFNPSRVEGKITLSLIVSATQITANGTDEAIISNIPAGVQVQWPDGQTDIVTGGEIRFSVDLPGTYTFRFTAVPYLDQEIIVEAIPAT